MRISDWSSDVCSSDLHASLEGAVLEVAQLGCADRRGASDQNEFVGRGKLHHLAGRQQGPGGRSEEHTSELQSLMRISYAVFCLKKKNTKTHHRSKLTRMYNSMNYTHKSHITTTPHVTT